MSQRDKHHRPPKTYFFPRPPNLKTLWPGIYQDGDTIRVMIPEVLADAGWQDTQENRDKALVIIKKRLAESFPGVEQVDDAHCPRCEGSGQLADTMMPCPHCQGRGCIVRDNPPT